MPSAPSSIADTMTAVLLTGHGGFDRLEVREDVPVPRPAPGEVLIRVAAAGVNNTDINTRIGWYSKAVTGAWAVPGLDQPVGLAVRDSTLLIAQADGRVAVVERRTGG